MMNSKVQLIARLVLALILVVFGANKFLHFLPDMEFKSTGAADFWNALVDTGYMIPLVGFVEVLIGLILFSGRYIPLALVLLGPITVNIVAFHLGLDLAGIGPAALVAVLHIYLLFANKSRFDSLLSA